MEWIALTLSFLAAFFFSSVDIFQMQFRPIRTDIMTQSWSGSKPFDSMSEIIFFYKFNFEKKVSQWKKKNRKITQHAKSKTHRIYSDAYFQSWPVIDELIILKQ